MHTVIWQEKEKSTIIAPLERDEQTLSFFFYTHEHTPHSTKLFPKISMYIKMK